MVGGGGAAAVALGTAVFFAGKLMTWWRWRRVAGAARALGYWFAWPGMDARRFFTGTPEPVTHGEPFAVAAKLALGAALVLAVPEEGGLAAATQLLAGLCLFFCFGFFHLLSLVWRRAGVAAPHIFRAPFFATSLGDFWGRRWNLAFHQLMWEFVFRPSRRRLGVTGAMWIVFVASGVAHEVVLSIPAGGGYGLPTLYFLLQGAGLALERRRRIRSRLYTILFAAAPLPLLFHAPFLRAVLLG